MGHTPVRVSNDANLNTFKPGIRFSCNGLSINREGGKTKHCAYPHFKFLRHSRLLLIKNNQNIN